MQLPNTEEFQRAEASPSLKSIKTRTSEVCKVCSSVEAKYTCPRCALKTCSLQCCLRHKKETGCSGKRNLAAFVSRKDYDYFNFLSDYRLLEAVDRDNETRERQLSELRQSYRRPQPGQSKLAVLARSLGIDFRALSPLLKRARMNKTFISTSGDLSSTAPTIMWSLEFCLLPSSHPEGGPRTCLRDDLRWCDQLLCPLRILVHSCHPDWSMETIWRDRVTALSSVEQENLVTNKAPAEAVVSWLLSTPPSLNPADSSSSFFFYIQCDGGKQQPGRSGIYPKHEIFPSTALSEVLTYDSFVIHEFPTVWVSRTELPTTG